MKSAIISGAILLCLILLISLNSFLCIDKIKNLEELLSSEDATTEAGVENVENYWNKHETFLHLGVNSRFIDSISESIVQLKAAIKTNSEEDVSSSLDMLKFRLDQLKKINRFNLSNVY